MTAIYILVLIVLLVATMWRAWRLSQRIDVLEDRTHRLVCENLRLEDTIEDLETRAAARVKRSRGLIEKVRRA